MKEGRRTGQSSPSSAAKTEGASGALVRQARLPSLLEESLPRARERSQSRTCHGLVMRDLQHAAHRARRKTHQRCLGEHPRALDKESHMTTLLHAIAPSVVTQTTRRPAWDTRQSRPLAVAHRPWGSTVATGVGASCRGLAAQCAGCPRGSVCPWRCGKARGWT